MVENNSQALLELREVKNYHPDDYFLSSSNQKAYNAIYDKNLGVKPYENILLIKGGKSTGKTCLAHIAAKFHNAQIITQTKDIGSCSTYIVDNGHDLPEEELLHIFNNILEEKKNLIIFAPINWDIKLKDLESRMNSIRVEFIEELDDDLMGVIISKAFSSRSIEASQEVINYLRTRLERNYEYIFNFVKNFDQFCLKHKKNITIKSASQYFAHIIIGDA